MKYRLNQAETTPITLYMFPVTKGTVTTYNHYMRLEPEKIYETDDIAQVNYLKNKTNKVRYRSELEELLKAKGVEYEVIYCKSCGGKVRKIEYKVIEVVE